jgi:hypothetical protein
MWSAFLSINMIFYSLCFLSGFHLYIYICRVATRKLQKPKMGYLMVYLESSLRTFYGCHRYSVKTVMEYLYQKWHRSCLIRFLMLVTLMKQYLPTLPEHLWYPPGFYLGTCCITFGCCVYYYYFFFLVYHFCLCVCPSNYGILIYLWFP